MKQIQPQAVLPANDFRRIPDCRTPPDGHLTPPSGGWSLPDEHLTASDEHWKSSDGHSTSPSRYSSGDFPILVRRLPDARQVTSRWLEVNRAGVGSRLETAFRRLKGSDECGTMNNF